MDPLAYSGLSKIEEKHWWYVTRRRLIAQVIACFVPPGKPSILEIGCGFGGNLPILAKFGNVSAVEPDERSRAHAIARGLGPVEGGAWPGDLPYDTVFDLVCLFDVLEHIEDDSSALQSLHGVLTDNGQIFITVPALGILWSGLDEAAHHKRRYTKTRLVSLAREQGFSVRYVTYFNAILFPPILIARLIQRILPRPTADAHFRLPKKPVNYALHSIFSLEELFIPRFSFPLGVSLMLLAAAN